MQGTLHRPTLAAVFAVLGLMLAVAFNTSTGPSAGRPERAADLPGVVRDMERQRSELQDRLAGLRAEMADAERKAAADAGVKRSFTRELEEARAAAGLIGVEGPGVEVVLGDGKDVPAGGDPNEYLIHDYDIAAVVNALIAGGAEAVSVNGERVVATTAIRCAGTTVLVNSSRLGNPYTVLAVGDADSLARGVQEDEAASLLFGTYKSRYGLEARLVARDTVVVPAYKGSMQPGYARPAGERS